MVSQAGQIWWCLDEFLSALGKATAIHAAEGSQDVQCPRTLPNSGSFEQLDRLWTVVGEALG